LIHPQASLPRIPHSLRREHLEKSSSFQRYVERGARHLRPSLGEVRESAVDHHVGGIGAVEPMEILFRIRLRRDPFLLSGADRAAHHGTECHLVFLEAIGIGIREIVGNRVQSLALRDAPGYGWPETFAHSFPLDR
jgi:hypothetical protein